MPLRESRALDMSPPNGGPREARLDVLLSGRGRDDLGLNPACDYVIEALHVASKPS